MPDLATDRHHVAFRFAEQQVDALVETHPDFFPIYTRDGRWHHQGELWTDWTGGFLVGMMWKFFASTGDDRWRRRAEHYSRLLEHRKSDRTVHDLGFIFLNTYLPWYELTGQQFLLDTILEAGRTLAMRFVEPGGYLCSFVSRDSLFIDIMMNVPLVLYTANQTGDQRLRSLAETHCRTTRDTIVRPDGSTAHEGIFDLQTGRFLRQSTHQGLADDSAWARGLAWSMYGFSKVYALTGMKEFLAVAERNAEFWLANLPDDHVPYWDFDADLAQPLPWGPQKDSSAGAIAASALLDLAVQAESPEHRIAYRNTALAMLDALVEPEYLADKTPGWEGILKHGVYHTRKNLGVDQSVMWGEFFVVEALSKVLKPGL